MKVDLNIKLNIKHILLFLGATIGGFITIYIIHFNHGISDNHTRWAEFGSFFGGIFGAAFSFTAVIILLATLEVNKRELSLTRQVLDQQLFESTFFEQLRLFRETTNNLGNTITKHQKYKVDTETVGNKLLVDLYLDLIHRSTEEVFYPLSREDERKKYIKVFSNIKASNPALRNFIFGFIAVAKYLTSNHIFSENPAGLKKYINILLSNTSPEGLTLVLANSEFTGFEKDLIQLLGIKEHLKSLQITSYLTEDS